MPSEDGTSFFLFLRYAGAAAAAAIACRTGAAVRAANALLTTLFGSPDKPHRKTKYQHNYGKNDIIYNIHILLLSAERIGSLKLTICPNAQSNNN